MKNRKHLKYNTKAHTYEQKRNIHHQSKYFSKIYENR